MLGLIAGTGLNKMADFAQADAKKVETPYGLTSGELTKLRINGQDVLLLPRHGQAHTVPPHLINYRANIWALKDAGVSDIVAFAAVGGISSDMSPATLVLPDQIIDYTYSREHTFYTDNFSADKHIDFTQPYSERLHSKLLAAAKALSINILASGTYACTQGPRLETAAEIQRLKKDACHIVGMTAMPEAALARELQINYQTLAVVVNWAAGISDDEITMESIISIMHDAEASLQKIITKLLT